MTAPTLWIEMTMAGSVYVASLLFLVLGCWRPDLESLAKHFDHLLPYIAVAVVALSYILGFVAHRLIQITNLVARGTAQWSGRKLTDWIAKRIANWQAEQTKEWSAWPRDLIAKRLKAWEKITAAYGQVKCYLKREHCQFLSSDLEQRMGEETTIWALNPQRIHHELDFQFAQVALLRSLLFSSPMLALSIGYWLYQVDRDHHLLAPSQVDQDHNLLTVGLCFLVFYLCLLPSFLRQHRQYEKIREKLLPLLKKPAGGVPSVSQTTEVNAAPLNATVTISGASDTGANFEVKFNCPVTVLPSKKE